MHRSRLAREFLHFMHIFCRSAYFRQVIEFTRLSNFLHFVHFLQALLLNCTSCWGSSLPSGWT